MNAATDPHAAQPLLAGGRKLEQADGAIILIHGRGSSAGDILSLFDELDIDRFAAFAPQAASGTWYPYSFLAPLEANQPYLDSALNRIESLVADLVARGMSSERVAILGFSQGACLASEFAARHPRRYGAILALTGGLIGPPATPRDYAGSLQGTPVFLGAPDPDPHVPFERVLETRDVFNAMHAKVEVRRYPGMPHSINEDQLKVCRETLAKISARKS